MYNIRMNGLLIRKREIAFRNRGIGELFDEHFDSAIDETFVAFKATLPKTANILVILREHRI